MTACASGAWGMRTGACAWIELERGQQLQEGRVLDIVLSRMALSF